MNAFTPIDPVPAARAHDFMHRPSRRDFLRSLGTGLTVLVFLDTAGLAAESEAARPSRVRQKISTDFNAFLRIDENGRVTCFTGKIEMGQGPVTSLPQTMAEELDVPVDQIDIIMGDTDLCPYDQGTWGSLTTRQFGPLMVAACAEARGVLLELGSEVLHVPVARLITRDGAVVVRDDATKRVTYGQLTQGKRIERHLTVKPEPKKLADYKIVGKPLLRRDSRAKVTGAAHYTGDLRVPGMLYASILRPPAHGAKLRSADTSAARAIDGIVVVEQPGLLAVLHALPDVAEAALEKIKVEYEPSPSTLDDQNIYAHLAASTVAPRVTARAGDIATGEKLATRRLDATYHNAYVAHAPMEPHTALVHIEGDRATVWASTQNPFGVREEVAGVLGLPVESVRVITPFVGGGFGGKSANQQTRECALLAKATGKPVMLQWTRGEEFFNDTFRPAAVVNIASGLDAAGRLVLWDYEVRFAGERGADLFYGVPHHRTTAIGNFNGPSGVHPFNVGAWRAPGANTNGFARETHLSRLAELAGEDPIAFRLRHMNDPRAKRCLEEAARIWGWTPAVGSSGRGLGVACGADAGSHVTLIAEVGVDRATGKVTVKRVLCVQEMGLLINPAGAKQQIESCIMMGMGYALSEEMHFKAGALVDTNFDTYEIPRFSWLPKMDTVILNADNTPPQGGGEPAIIVMGSVLANAVYDACGAKLTALPMTPARIKAALAG